MTGTEFIKAFQEAIRLGGDGQVSLTVSMGDYEFTVDTEEDLIITNTGNKLIISNKYPN